MYKYGVIDIANWFLSKEPMVHRKLQKLCYYAQAWHLAFTDKKLFANDFEAWAHGPVCRALWSELKDYGFNNIETNHFSHSKKIEDEIVLNVLNEVWRVYGNASAFALESVVITLKK